MNRLWVALVLALSAPAVSAEPISYLCNYVDNSGRSGLHQKAVYVIDAELGTAMALDPYIKQSHSVPIPTSVKEIKPGRFLLKWKLDKIPMRNSNRNLVGTFAARVDTSKMSSTISVNIHGSDGTVRGSGSCSLLEG